ncbi:glycosyltransferase family 4 protein [Mucilaginibacter sp. UYCu711]|uniref:glycosyltransferase family 4 protein n=1 Tax=Mucilaginibacter sp. UYCu711 TaxID=3156339 RepID=UPI003D222218
MKFVFASYISANNYTDPAAWLERIKAYTGVLEAVAANHEVISIEQINYEGDEVKNGVNYRFKKFNKRRYFPLKLNLFISRQKPDVVFIHSLHFPLQVMLLRLVLGRKPKIIIQNHAEKPFKGIKKRLLLLSESAVNAYLFASRAMGLEWIAKGNLTSQKKIHEVMELSSFFHPIPKATARAKTGITEANPFLWVGRLDQNKDPLTVIKAFLKFAAATPSACLYMLYHTEELLPEIQQLLSTAPNAAAIKLIGKVPNDELLYWHNSVDFIVAGSHYEGSGTAVCEAMSCGCIPIVTDIFSFRMMTDNGNIGLLYEAGNEGELLSALQQTNSLNISAEKEKALAYFNSTLSFEAIAGRIGAIAASC